MMNMIDQTRASQHPRRRHLATAAVLAGCALVVTGCTMPTAGGPSPQPGATPTAPSTGSPAAPTDPRLGAAALAGAAALSRAAAGGGDLRDARPDGSPLAAFAAAAAALGATTTWASSGRAGYPATGLLSVYADPRHPAAAADLTPVAGDPVICVKVPVTNPRHPPSVLQTPRLAASTAAATHVTVFDGISGTSCAVFIEGAATNLIPNPALTQRTTGWRAWNATLTLTPAPDGLPARDGAGAAQVTTAAAGSGQTPPASVTPGAVYSGSIWVYSSSALNLCGGYNYADSAGKYLWTGPCHADTHVNGGWTRLTIAATAMPAGAATASIYVAPRTGTGTYYLTAAQIEPGDTITSYVDGDLGPGYTWTGPADTSASLRADGTGIG